MNDPSAILNAIAAYATAYAALEALQGGSSLLPRGDQKTGCFGEFYARLYLQRVRPAATVAFGGHSNKAWDLRVTEGSRELLVQVKTVSGFSATRILSPIHHGWHELFVVSLDRAFRPDGFWVVPPPDIPVTTFPLRGVRAPSPSSPTPRSGPLDFSNNQLPELLLAIAPGT